MDIREDTYHINRVKEGDREAFSWVVDQYGDMVYTLCLRMLTVEADASDAAQEVFVKAFRSAGGFREKSKFSTWLYRITVNAASDLRQKEARRRARSLDDGPLGQSLAGNRPGPGARAATAELRAIVRREIDMLSPKLRTILKLRELEGLSYEELAQVLNISKGTVESRLFRAREKLALRLRKIL